MLKQPKNSKKRQHLKKIQQHLKFWCITCYLQFSDFVFEFLHKKLVKKGS